jgi:plastocyanin
MSFPLRAVALVAVLLGAFLLPAPSSSAASDLNPIALTLYGHSIRGWGFNSSTLKVPGPNLTVYVGVPVSLTLIGADPGVAHNWFIDYDNNNVPNGAEPSSPDFVGPTPKVYSFTPDRAGNWTYKCRYHFTMMIGTIHVLAPKNVTLYGDSIRGWGLTNKTIRSPGPRIVLVAGTNVTFTLISNDSDSTVKHNLFIDYNGDGVWNAGEPKSPDFNSSAILPWGPVHLDRAGNFTYHCAYHGGMLGNVLILGRVLPTGGLNVGLIPGIMILALSFVLVFAAVYHIRAVRAAKRMK